MPPDIPTIFEASASDDRSMLELALQYYDVNDVDGNGMTGLHYASASLSFSTAERLLLEEDVDVHVKDKFDREAAIMGFEVHGYSSDMGAKINVLIWPQHPDDLDLLQDADADAETESCYVIPIQSGDPSL